MAHDDDNLTLGQTEAGSPVLASGLSARSDALAPSKQLEYPDSGSTWPESQISALSTRLGVEETIAHYTDLYDSAPVGYFRLDRNGTIIEVNLTGAGLLGITRASLLRRRLEEFISIDMHASFNAFLKQVFQGESKETCELRFLDTDRKAFFAHLEANADEERKTCRLVLCDISDRKQAELSLIESEERFRLMADSAPVLIWIAGPNRDYLWFNRMWLDFTGRDLEDELGSRWLEGVHPDDMPACINAHAAALDSRTPFTVEYRLRHRNGQFHTMLAHGVPRVSPLGRFLGYIGTCTDITERKKMEDALQHSREMLRHLVSHQERVREDERKRIARELHDDLGQNLLALRIDVAMLHDRTRVNSKLNERVRLALSHIDATMKAVRAAINNLRPTVLDLGLNAAIEWQVKDFERRSGINSDLRMEDDIVLDDNRATALFRILQESLNNVIRHAQASSVSISLRITGEKLFMQIADNGIGIYPDCRRKANSFGLIGIEERIIALGGELDIQSNTDRGTTVTVSIPVEPA